MKEGQLVQKIQKSDMGNRNYFLKEKYRTLYAELLNRNKTGQGLVQPWAFVGSGWKTCLFVCSLTILGTGRGIGHSLANPMQQSYTLGYTALTRRGAAATSDSIRVSPTWTNQMIPDDFQLMSWTFLELGNKGHHKPRDSGPRIWFQLFFLT